MLIIRVRTNWQKNFINQSKKMAEYFWFPQNSNLNTRRVRMKKNKSKITTKKVLLTFFAWPSAQCRVNRRICTSHSRSSLKLHLAWAREVRISICDLDSVYKILVNFLNWEQSLMFFLYVIWSSGAIIMNEFRKEN